MKKNEQKNLRPELEQMSDLQLQTLLHTQLKTEPVDGDLVRLILAVLKAREPAAEPEISKESMAAWDAFKENCAQDRQRMADRPSSGSRNRLLKTAAALAVVAMLIFAIPAVSGTENVAEMFSRWTDSIFDFFRPEAVQPAYVFETDHPGLQKLYDTVTSYGITQPVVPMWLPEGYELTEIKTTNTPTKVRISAIFHNDEKTIVFTVEVYGADTPYKYETEEDEESAIKVELGEVMHYVKHNDTAWIAVWTTDNLKCSITVDCPEDILYRILRSIYKLEVF